MTLTTTTPTDLTQRWNQLLLEQPHLRIRNAAKQLGVSEAELLGTRIGSGVTRLRPDFRAILAQVGTLGPVMALTRNEDVVHERQGTYLNPSLGPGPVGLFVGEEIDLRIFWGAWASAFAVEEPGRDGVRYSLQFFAGDGEAIHKIYLTERSDLSAYHSLVVAFGDKDPSTGVSVTAYPAERPGRTDAEVDVAAFQAGWLALKDTHDFHLLLRDHGLTRTQALRLAPAGHAVQVDRAALRDVLTAASANGLPIMVFVGNKGMLQIHTGTVHKLLEIPEWYNVTDPDFNLHIREAALASCWVVRKPTVDGPVTALECFDAEGRQLVQLFGKRKPGLPELEAWRALIDGIASGRRVAPLVV